VLEDASKTAVSVSTRPVALDAALSNLTRRLFWVGGEPPRGRTDRSAASIL